MAKRDARRRELTAVVSDGAAEFDRLLTARTAATSAAGQHAAHGVVLGTLVAFQEHGATPFVTYGETGATPVAARSTIDLQASHIGQTVVLMFDENDARRPIVLGVVRQPGVEQLRGTSGVEVDADGQRLVVTAERGLVLRCGKASITLTPDGKVAVRGTQIVSHASGLNRIRGGAVQVN